MANYMREHCPTCGSTDLVLTNGSYSTGCGCLGFLLFGWVGLLLGLLGLGNYELVCKHCGSRWPVGKPHKANSGGCGCLTVILVIIIIAVLAGCSTGGECNSQDTAAKQDTTETITSDPAFDILSVVRGWKLENHAGEQAPTLMISSSGDIYGSGGVNRYNGKLDKNCFSEGKFKLAQPIGSTRMMGPPEAMAAEQDFLQKINSAETLQLTGEGKLELRSADKALLIFVPVTLTSQEYYQLLKPNQQ